MGHATVYNFDRLKIVVPIIIVLIFWSAIVTGARAVAALWMIAIFSNVISTIAPTEYLFARRSFSVGPGLRQDARTLTALEPFSKPCTLFTSAATIRGYANMLTGRSIQEKVTVSDMEALTKKRSACLGVWIASSRGHTGLSDKVYIFDPSNDETIMFDGMTGHFRAVSAGDARLPLSLVPADITDKNWTRGVWTVDHTARFAAAYSDDLALGLSRGDTLMFRKSGARTVIDVSSYASWLNITVDGDRLEPIGDGFPNQVALETADH